MALLKFGYLWTDNTRSALSSYLKRLRARSSFRAAIHNDEMPLPMLLAGLRRTFLSINT
ncbi:hypothetical protein [Dulcicalothrix desertica]|uniref:hypothetical protein n=1 Tax=Dulcicalothrix desertica TaxID=32056 RepID=UPI001646DB39|nr:hypothetical protein [Dulcicalothrix desertica]